MTENIIHLVLARTPDAPEGRQGHLAVRRAEISGQRRRQPGARNDARCVSIEHKLGIHASPTCVMAYGDNGGAVGYLVGEENRGLEYMFVMMNAARSAVGLEGVAIAERAYQRALEYARSASRAATPVEGRRPGADHPPPRRAAHAHD
jgi:alkylation response protein AidB-like acyl-CoA dehydrogenase